MTQPLGMLPAERGPLAPGQLWTCALHLQLWSCKLCSDAAGRGQELFPKSLLFLPSCGTASVTSSPPCLPSVLPGAALLTPGAEPLILPQGCQEPGWAWRIPECLKTRGGEKLAGTEAKTGQFRRCSWKCHVRARALSTHLHFPASAVQSHTQGWELWGTGLWESTADTFLTKPG